MTQTPPTIRELTAIAPSNGSARADVLTYDHLAEEVKTQSPFDGERLRKFLDAEPGSLSELRAARVLARLQLVHTALRATTAVSEESRELWADRYTQQSAELYGEPEPEKALEIGKVQTHALLVRARDHGVDHAMVGRLEEWAGELGFDKAAASENEVGEVLFGSVAHSVREWLEETYGDVFEALDLDNAPASIDTEGMAKRFEAGLAVLKARDPAWNDWEVVCDPERDLLTVIAGKKQILVGMKRANATPLQLKGLFAHEVLIHAQRGMNGAKLSKELGGGLPDYLDTEEGLGVLVEYAITGELPEKVLDRYVDISLALGQITGAKMTRAELLKFAMLRARVRNSLKADPASDEDVERAVYAHVNRIYRGSRGDRHVGVFTKDIVYYTGFASIGRYISAVLHDGVPIADVMNLLLSAKFDPTNVQHFQNLLEARAKSRLAGQATTPQG